MNILRQQWVKSQRENRMLQLLHRIYRKVAEGRGCMRVKASADGDTYIYLPLFHYNFCMTMRKSGRT